MTTEESKKEVALAGLVGQPGPEDKPLELKLNRHERRKFLRMVKQEKARVEKRTKRMEVKRTKEEKNDGIFTKKEAEEINNSALIEDSSSIFIGT